MQIVTDSGSDLTFEEAKKINVHMLPLKVDLDGKSYRSGLDISPDQFYDLMEKAAGMPVTSTPSVGEFAELYRELAKTDPEILSIHISSGLSGTSNAAVQAAKLVPEAQITILDTLTLSAGTGWQVLAAVKMRDAGAKLPEVLEKLRQIQAVTKTYFSLPTLKYLIAGGRIGHLKGLLASLLGILPVIWVSNVDGKYYDVAKKRTFIKAIEEIPSLILKDHPAGSLLQAQICHASYPEGARMVKEALSKVFKLEFLPDVNLGTALGAHTGRGLTGVIVARKDQLPSIS
ncbi:MAG TPA: DegV family protein [Anaerolineaceae bacterium]|nr:DegV family protein [Anaerolineaceae bacterium]